MGTNLSEIWQNSAIYIQGIAFESVVFHNGAHCVQGRWVMT